MADSRTEGAFRTPLHPGLINAGSTLLICALLTDVMYWRTSLQQWANFSAWLIMAGLVLAALAAVALVIDLLGRRAARVSWPTFLVVAAAALLSLLNALVHTRDSWTSVVPQGIALSCVVTVLLIFAAARGWRVTHASDLLEARRA